MHAAVIQSPQAMSNDQSYRPRSPDLPGLAESQQHQQHRPPRLNRLPSYQIEEPNLPKGYSFSPRGSYDASPFFSQPQQQASNPYIAIQPGNPYPIQSPPHFVSDLLPDQPQAFSPISFTESPQRHQGINSFPKSPLHYPYIQQYPEPTYQPTPDDMARLRSRKPVNYNEDHSNAQYEEPPPTFHQPPMHHFPQQQQQPPPPPPPQAPQMLQYPQQPQFMQSPMPLMQQPIRAPLLQQQPLLPPQPTAPPMAHIDVKTKFPVARIKRIMQADEDVGKVAQATPTAVSKALELFMIALVSKGAVEAKNNNSKRVTATHLKHALLTDPQFDFLNEICEAVPDEGAKGSKGRAKSEAKSEDSDEDMGGAPKKKAKGGRKKKGGDDDGSD